MDEPQAVVSHQSALVLHELTELLPGEIHLTVPPKFRKLTPQGCVLHKGVLSAGDSEKWAGFRVTSPRRTLLDVAGGSVSLKQFAKAVNEALTRGLVRRKALDAAMEDSPHRLHWEVALGHQKATRQRRGSAMAKAFKSASIAGLSSGGNSSGGSICPKLPSGRLVAVDSH